jgi:predicted metal-binding membrane protein
VRPAVPAVAWFNRTPRFDRTPANLALAALAVAIAAAWLLAVVAQLTGNAGALHHHALIEPGAPPLWIGLPMFLVAWLVMVVGMMLPGSLRAIGAALAAPVGSVGLSASRQPGRALAGFLAAYALVWLGFGLVAFIGDMGLHALVHASAWLAARPFLIEAAVLALAGVYQFAPVKRRGLEACRHPQALPLHASAAGPARGGFEAGFSHAIDCVASSWALMLLMFAAGFANLIWMAVLAIAMAYEALGRHGRRSASAFGVALLWLALVAATGVTIAF